MTYGFWRASHRYEPAGVDDLNAARANIRANKPVPERRKKLHAVQTTRWKADWIRQSATARDDLTHAVQADSPPRSVAEPRQAVVGGVVLSRTTRSVASSTRRLSPSFSTLSSRMRTARAAISVSG